MSIEEAPTSPTLKIEYDLYMRGTWPAAGLDEVGRGAWAGPVVAAAVILPPPSNNLSRKLHGVRDSKLMSASQREHWSELIEQTAVEISLGVVPAAQVDAIGVLGATRLAMSTCVKNLQQRPAHLIIDYLELHDVDIPQTAVTHGDNLVLSIAAASVVAKVARDQMMVKIDKEYPGYAFSRNKGYGTREHREALRKNGICPYHRRSYRPIAQLPLPGMEE
jgi:ribonuclease HII